MALQLLRRRWLLYLLTCSGVFAAQALFVHLVHVKFAVLFAGLAGAPFVNAVVMLYTGADASGAMESLRARLERLSERAWAIVLLDVGISLIATEGYGAILSSDASMILQGSIIMFMAAMLVYAEPYAILENEVSLVTLIPAALLRSMMLSWVNMSRVFSLFAVQLGAAIIAMLFFRDGLAGIAFGTFVTALLSALFAVAYLDTLAQERAAAP